MNHHLIVLSLLDGKGPTGVEAHFNGLIESARAKGIASMLVSAYPAQRWWASLVRRAGAALARIAPELAAVLLLWIDSRVLAAKLRPLLTRARQHGAAVTLYAQDPVSARVAVAARQHQPCRVVTVVHYNISQADELVMQGQARPGGLLCRHLLRAEAQALPQVDHLVFVSAFMQGELRTRLAAIRAVPQSVIPNGIRGSSGQDGAAAVAGDLIAIGTLEARKNQAFLLQVIARAKARGVSCSLTVVGDGPDRTRLEILARQLGLRDQVRFTGRLAHAAGLIPRHRILVHGALMENLPIALIEALAAGRPILAPAVGGIGEIYRDGMEGYFWPLDDIDRAASLLVELMSDGVLYQRMAQAARARYLAHFDSARLTARWLATILDAPVAFDRIDAGADPGEAAAQRTAATAAQTHLPEATP